MNRLRPGRLHGIPRQIWCGAFGKHTLSPFRMLETCNGSDVDEKSKMSKWITVLFSPLKYDKKMNINENNVKHSSIGRSPQDQLTCFHPSKFSPDSVHPCFFNQHFNRSQHPKMLQRLQFCSNFLFKMADLRRQQDKTRRPTHRESNRLERRQTLPIASSLGSHPCNKQL